VAFAEDLSGEVYAVNLFGTLWKLERAPKGAWAPRLPSLLSQTGLFDDTARLVPRAGLLPYEVNTPLWSDGAQKRRWLFLPSGAKIHFDPTKPWNFPAGTILVKEFDLDLGGARPRRLELRVLIDHRQGWEGYTYKWNATGTDATLLPDSSDGLDEALTKADGNVQQVWHYPSRGQCLACHKESSGGPLGVNTYQLAGRNKEQLREWSRAGVFTNDIGDVAGLPFYSSIDDSSAPVYARVRSYLAANCVYCHNPRGFTPVSLDLRYGSSLAATLTLKQAPLAGDLDIPGALLVTPGHKESSVLWQRMVRVQDKRMPPLGSNIVDKNATDLIGAWIDRGAGE